MSGHDATIDLNSNAQHRPVDANFSRLSQHHGEPSSQAESSKSSGRGSRHSKETGEDSISSTRRASGEQRRHDSRKQHKSRRSGGFLLETVLGNGQLRKEGSGDKHGKRRMQPNGNLHRGEVTNSWPSGELSLGTSPLSREVSATDGEEEQSTQMSSPTSVDPAQLVQMALTLSESRKRHVSGPLQLPLPSPKDSRRISKGERDGLQSSSGRQRRSYVYEDFSLVLPTPRVPGRWISESRPQDSRAADEESYLPNYFSPATLSRAEKARKYFELASEYRRLLQYLPPLKPDVEALGNYTYYSTSSPGSAHSQLIRVPSYAGNKHRLGRAYNPLQALRNRRLRARERQLLPAPPESWQAMEAISSWVDEVQEAAKDPSYRSLPDRVRLPSYPGELDSFPDAQEPGKGHRRADTNSTIIVRPENGWSIEPPELLADVYWTEKGNNKNSLENRFGSPIFPQNRLSVERHRRSQDLDRTAAESEKKDGSSDDLTSQKPSSRLHLLTMPRKRMTRSPSTTSAESDEGRKPPAPRYGNDAGGDENVGPLSRHMQEMIAKEERGELSSPEPNPSSPNHWQSQQAHSSALNYEQPPRKDVHANEHGLPVRTAFQHRRSKSADGRVGDRNHALSSLKDSSSAEPTSQIADDNMQSTSMDLSTTQRDNHALLYNKSRLSRLPIFRSHSKERDNIEHTDFALNDENRPGSDARSSLDSTRPSLITRHKTTESMSGSLRKQATRTAGNGSIKGSSTNLSRFLKGGRIGELVRGEGSRLGGRFRSKDHLDETAAGSDGSTISDDSEGDGDGAITPVILADDGTSTWGSFEREQRRPKYTLQKLPSFRSPEGRSNAAALDDDPIRRQEQARGGVARPSRLDRLAPPGVNLPHDDSNSSDTEKHGPFGSNYRFTGANLQDVSRTSAISIELPKDTRHPSQIPMTGFSQLSGQSGRHWSISDRALPAQVHRVTLRDINRVKALILASGIKAKEIQRRADMPRERPLAVIKQVADFVGQDFREVPKKNEHIVASQLLSEKLGEMLAQFDTTIARFERGPARDLGSQLDNLHQKASDQLTKLVHETSDEADALVIELTTRQPQDVKRVDDAINDLLRQRRRQFRLLRHFGFKLLEWTVLGILWGVWFVVVIINTFRRVVIGIFRFFKWLFWF